MSLENINREVPYDKWSLKDYLKTFDLNNEDELKQNANEILEHIKEVMDLYASGDHGEALKDYYSSALRFVERSFEKKDFKKDFPDSLDFLISSIEWE